MIGRAVGICANDCFRTSSIIARNIAFLSFVFFAVAYLGERRSQGSDQLGPLPVHIAGLIE
jgi:hypothetical protein